MCSHPSEEPRRYILILQLTLQCHWSTWTKQTIKYGINHIVKRVCGILEGCKRFILSLSLEAKLSTFNVLRMKRFVTLDFVIIDRLRILIQENTYCRNRVSIKAAVATLYGKVERQGSNRLLNMVVILSKTRKTTFKTCYLTNNLCTPNHKLTKLVVPFVLIVEGSRKSYSLHVIDVIMKLLGQDNLFTAWNKWANIIIGYIEIFAYITKNVASSGYAPDRHFTRVLLEIHHDSK